MKHWESWGCFSDLWFTWYQSCSEMRHLFNRDGTSGFWKGPKSIVLAWKWDFSTPAFCSKSELHFVEGCDILCVRGALWVSLCFHWSQPQPQSQRGSTLALSPFLGLFHLVLFGFGFVWFVYLVWGFFVIFKSNPSFPFQKHRSVQADVAGISWKYWWYSWTFPVALSELHSGS